MTHARFSRRLAAGLFALAPVLSPLLSPMSGAERSSAEIIVESPSGSSGVLPLADFGSVTFTGCKVDGDTLGSFDPTAITSPGLTVSLITGGTKFTVTESKTAALG